MKEETGEIDTLVVEMIHRESEKSSPTRIPSDQINVECSRIEEKSETQFQTGTKTTSEEDLKTSRWTELTAQEAFIKLETSPVKYKRGILYLDHSGGRVRPNEGFKYLGVHSTEVHLFNRSRAYTGRAFNGDDVVVEIIQLDEETNKVQGKIVAIIKHRIDYYLKEIVCMIDRELNDLNLVIPINIGIPKIRLRCFKQHRREDHVAVYDRMKLSQLKRYEPVNLSSAPKKLIIVKYLKWEPKCSHPLGVAVDIMSSGITAEKGIKILNIEYDVQDSHDANIIKQARSLKLPKTVYQNRTNMTDLHTFTIDPEKSKDLDDAISVSEEADGLFRVGIHIADVTHHIPKDGIIDADAYQRATSFYCPEEVGKVVHMLPTPLSTDLCSLVPLQKRLTLSIMVTLSKEGGVLNVEKPVRSFIRSRCRLSYSEAENLLNCGDDDLKDLTHTQQRVTKDLKLLATLTKKMRINRLGTMSHNVHFNDQSEENSYHSHKMIEELMLLANREIARFLVNKFPECIPLRRQLPPEDAAVQKWLESNEGTARLSFGLRNSYCDPTKCNCSRQCRCHRETISKKTDVPYVTIVKSRWDDLIQAVNMKDNLKMQRILGNMENFPQQTLAQLNWWGLQDRASYICSGDVSGEELRHFSLNMNRYTHFTSPIRRFIDIVVHRLVKAAIDGSPCPYSREEVSKISNHCTLKSKEANSYEQDTTKLCAAIQLKERALAVDAVVSEVNEKGLKLHFYTEKDCGPSKKLLGFRHLDLNGKPEVNEMEQTTKMNWKFRCYNVHLSLDELTTRRCCKYMF